VRLSYASSSSSSSSLLPTDPPATVPTSGEDPASAEAKPLVQQRNDDNEQTSTHGVGSIVEPPSPAVVKSKSALDFLSDFDKKYSAVKTNAIARALPMEPLTAKSTALEGAALDADTMLAARFVGEDLSVTQTCAYPSTAVVASTSVGGAPSRSGSSPPTPAVDENNPLLAGPPVTVVIVFPPDANYGVEFFPGAAMGGGVVVKDVTRGGAADLAGLCVGDALVVVNNVDARGMTLAVILEVMREKRSCGEPVRFEVARSAYMRARVQSL
jgi:hypothetical protein